MKIAFDYLIYACYNNTDKMGEEYNMVILGIDPGLAIVGWGALQTAGSSLRVLGYGCIRTPAHTPVEKRLAAIYSDMNTLLSTFKPDALSIEELFWNTNQTTGIQVAEARGVILTAAEQHGVAVNEYTPLQVKQAVVGYGRAEKKQVIAMVTSLLGLKKQPSPDDTADALAMAICHASCAQSSLAGFPARY